MTSGSPEAIDPEGAQATTTKGVLFCPNCSHQSQYDGDWNVVRSAQSTRYVCPDCRTEITSRPPPDISRAPFTPHGLLEMWQTNIRLLQKVFRM